MRVRGSALLALVIFYTVFGTGIVQAVSLTAIPVILHFAPGQQITSMTVVNHGREQIGFQVRPFAWTQHANKTVLTPTRNLLVSPPLGSLKAGARQIIRFALRLPPKVQESSYRILLDEIPPPAAPDTIRIALRLSIPIFAEPQAPTKSHVHWLIERRAGKAFLEGINRGKRHETVRNILLTTADGRRLHVKMTGTPYILAGAMRRWPIETSNTLSPGATLQMTAETGSGHIATRVKVAKKP